MTYIVFFISYLLSDRWDNLNSKMEIKQYDKNDRVTFY